VETKWRTEQTLFQNKEDGIVKKLQSALQNLECNDDKNSSQKTRKMLFLGL
jgi:hypothetical protein